MITLTFQRKNLSRRILTDISAIDFYNECLETGLSYLQRKVTVKTVPLGHILSSEAYSLLSHYQYVDCYGRKRYRSLPGC